MVKDIKYIIKRIIIGTGIALMLMAIKGNIFGKPFVFPVYAQEMTSTNVGTYTDTITTNTAFTDYTITGNPWANWRFGHLYFSFGINKVSGSATDPLLVPRNVYAASDTTNYVCQFGTASYGNSTYEGASYSVDCPMDLGWPGVTKISIAWMPISTPTTSTYKVVIGGWMTFEQNPNTTVNVDTSGTTTAINNQITNDNTNTTNIINNQNQNTQQQIESQKVCSMIDKNYIIIDDSFLGFSGDVGSDSRYGITNFISVSSTDELILFDSLSSSTSFCFYDVNKDIISCSRNNSFSDNTIITIPSSASFFRSSINKVSNKPTFSLCRNGNQAIADGQQQINDTLNDDTGVSNSDLSDLFGELESSDTPISDLLTMPITLLNAYIDGFEGTCQRISLGSLYGENIILPCINLEDYLGSTLFGMIDVLICIYLIYNLSQLFITAFDDLTSLKDNFDWLYGVEGGRHAAATRSQRWE